MQSVSEAENPTPKAEKKPLPWYVEIPLVMFVTLVVIVLIQTFIGRLYVIPSASMEPTLHGCAGCTGDRIIVDKITYDFSDPKPGDVVVFKGTDSWNEGFFAPKSEGNPVTGTLRNIASWVGLASTDENDLVKRVIATGGQTVQCLEGDEGLKVDGKLIDNSYIQDPPANPISGPGGSEACGGPYFGPVKVPEGNLWVMGDNRTNSADSRYHMGDQYQGTIPQENVIGKVRWIVFPFSRIQSVDSYDIQG
ncbi:signal peptidase I [Corynebacterium gerontici]|uniref:signal peptidase I n=1 Tax=Corynebacterium gerontici TaxID=2079234 RepID=UPI001FE3D393|nr:signal peptidase I [Corynebacterium gerontici]